MSTSNVRTRARTRWCSALVGALAATAGLATVPSLGEATTYGTTRIASPRPELRVRWGERQAATGADYNADGVSDYFVGTPSRKDAVVRLMSGATGGVLRRFLPPTLVDASDFGGYLAVLGDVDGDALPDIAIGASQASTATTAAVGRAFVYSATGTRLYTLENPNPRQFAQYGSRLARTGDLNGDGVADLVVGASNNAPHGQAYIYSGKPSDHGTGQTGLIRTLNPPADDAPAGGTSIRFGLSVSSPGDVGTPPAPGSTDAGPPDGVADQIVDAGYYNNQTGRQYLFDGASGAVIRKIDSPEPQAGAIFGFQDAVYALYPPTPGTPVYHFDVNGDGHADTYGNGFMQKVGTTNGQGRAWVFDGKTGAVLYTLDDPTPEVGGQYGWSMAATNYDNRSGGIDLYVGQAPHHVPPPASSGIGGTYVMSGVNGALLQALEMPSACAQTTTSNNLGPNLGWSLAAPGDLSGDGLPDYLAGAPYYDNSHGGVTNQDQGVELVFTSATTTASGFSCNSPIPPPPPPVVQPADFDGNATTDVSFFRPSNGKWYVRDDADLVGNIIDDHEGVAWGATGDVPAPGDYDGDLVVDMAVFRPSTAEWRIRKSSGGTSVVTFGASGDEAVPGDYDGDGKTDPGVFRASDGTWRHLKSSDGTTASVSFAGTSSADDIRVPADYDGDGSTDPAYLECTKAAATCSAWHVRDSAGTDVTSTWGGTWDDIPAPADYDGDRLADLAFFSPATATWRVLYSTGGELTATIGAYGDVPQPGDYDGDLVVDLAVFRPSDGTWRIRKSGADPRTAPLLGDTVVSWGNHKDRPLVLPQAIRDNTYRSLT